MKGKLINKCVKPMGCLCLTNVTADKQTGIWCEVHKNSLPSLLIEFIDLAQRKKVFSHFGCCVVLFL